MILLMFQSLFHPYAIFAAFLSSRTSVRLGAVILVSGADIFLSESLRIPAERLSQSEIGLRLR